MSKITVSTVCRGVFSEILTASVSWGLRGAALAAAVSGGRASHGSGEVVEEEREEEVRLK